MLILMYLNVHKSPNFSTRLLPQNRAYIVFRIHLQRQGKEIVFKQKLLEVLHIILYGLINLTNVLHVTDYV